MSQKLININGKINPVLFYFVKQILLLIHN
jgi:hypothetical protein